MASISFNDGAALVLSNAMPDPTSRFSNWKPTTNPVGASANRASDGALSMFRTRTDYGASFELRNIPAKKAAGIYGAQLLTAPTDFTNGVWNGANVSRVADSTFPLSDLSGALPTTKLTVIASAAATLNQSIAVNFSRVRYRVIAHKFTGPTTANRVQIFDNTAAADLMAVSINYDTGVLTSTIPGVNEKFWANPIMNGWWDINIESDTVAGHTFTFYVGWAGGAATAGEAMVASSAQVLPFGTTRNTDIADRLIAHLLGGGTCSVTTNDKDASVYATCGLAPGTRPTLTLADPKLMEYTLSLSLINLAGSPVQMVCHYV